MSKLNDFEVIERLGEGSYSQVFKVKRKSDSGIYAMKKVRLFDLKEKEKDNALNEVRILASINDPFIISYKDAFIDDNFLCIIMEFASGGDLQFRIKEAQKTGFVPEKEIWKALLHIAKGLKTLHDMKIVHRDLKAANIFICDGVYKLGDLNVSKITKKGFAYTQTGTPYYASPEVWRNEPYNQMSDIWSLGCVIYEFSSLKLPFKAPDLQQLCRKVQRGLFETLPRQYSRDLQSMITQLIQVQPLKRLSCNQIINSPLMAKFSKQMAQEKIEPQNQQLLQTIHMPKNIQQLKLPKSNYEDTQSQRLQNQRAHSALPGQIREKNNLSPINQQRQLSRNNREPGTPVSQPSQRVYSSIPISREKLLQEQLKQELKREQEKLQKKRNDSAQQRQRQQQQSNSAHKPDLSNEAIRQQIMKNHKLEKIDDKRQTSANKQQQQQQAVSPKQHLISQRQKSQPEVVKKERIILSAQPSTRQQENIQNQNQASNDELVISGLKNINPKSIQSILCQPVIQINENPFPSIAKVVRQSKNNLGEDNYQHYFPLQQEFNSTNPQIK